MFTFFYFFLAALVGLCATGRRPGFLITFILAVLITPFLMLLILYLTNEGGEYAGKSKQS